MSETATHTVKIIGADGILKAEFTCHGGTESACHQFPDCGCESWIPGDHEHPFTAHERCWIQDWFDNGCTDPMDSTNGDETLTEAGYRSGMSGPIETYFCQDYIEWEFLPASPSEGRAQ